ncbi:sigma-54-dependent transcriptional regulator [Nitrincola iocasae]|uniref:Sigma-54-dependent Fis family transcriptional regulator n=1 Tax=Nitrincola iocasae TaxID=2614693 RepID=A0A5J6LAW0_9GAMM|nr:sigma-54 dependent transcriptional regulator [Nitrincola iocasae]QEW05448.1 sigma-54-dependent Fis family transcriptional regulator [Nitrincola iocasae]
MTTKVLIVEDDLGLREALTDTLALEGIAYVEAGSGEEALQLLKSQVVDMVISDVNMPGMDGHALLAQIRQTYPMLPVALITAYGQVERAVDAIRQGAVDYLMKPFEPSQLIELILRYAGGVLDAGTEVDPVAVAPSSQQLLQLARRVAVTDSTVLITGESGTGKEVLARYIHTHSGRVDRPFVAINCAAIPESMLEATLFGHEKGAFTGALQAVPGKFEQANGGTLLLDEISEMDLGLQAKLLRVLQEQEVERIGSRKLIKLDVRVLATSNRDLVQCVADRSFREDLYYRLNVFPLQWLPLRERPEDIVPLAQRLLHYHCHKMRRNLVSLSETVATALTSHPWPGNVRELDNVMQRALILQSGTRIQPTDLHLLDSSIKLQESAVIESQWSEPLKQESGAGVLDQDLRQHEYQIIVEALVSFKGSRKLAAEHLGISPRTLRYKLAKIREQGIDLEQVLASK